MSEIATTISKLPQIIQLYKKLPIIILQLRGYTPLNTACRKLYSRGRKLRDTNSRWDWIELLDEDSLEDEDNRYSYFAQRLSDKNDIYGYRTKSDYLEKIDRSKLYHEYNFSNDCENIVSIDGRVKFEKIHLKRSAIKDFIREIEQSSNRTI